MRALKPNKDICGVCGGHYPNHTKNGVCKYCRENPNIYKISKLLIPKKGGEIWQRKQQEEKMKRCGNNSNC